MEFNNSLTHDKSFVTAMKNAIPQFYEKSIELADDICTWEFLKYKIRIFSEIYTEDKAKERRAARLNLEHRAKEL